MRISTEPGAFATESAGALGIEVETAPVRLKLSRLVATTADEGPVALDFASIEIDAIESEQPDGGAMESV